MRPEIKNVEKITIAPDAKSFRSGKGQIIYRPETQIILFNRPIRDISERKHQDTYDKLRKEISITWQIDPNNIAFYNPVLHKTLISRSAFALETLPDGNQGFIKMSREARMKQMLENEYRAGIVAEKVFGYPTLPFIRPYTESNSGLAMVEYLHIGEQDGRFVPNTLEGMATLPKGYGKTVAEIIIPRILKPIPLDIIDKINPYLSNPLPRELGAVVIKDADWRAWNTDEFLNGSQPKKPNDDRGYRREVEIILAHSDKIDRGQAKGENRSGKIRQLFNEAEEFLVPFLQSGEQNNDWYFGINDVAAQNHLLSAKTGKFSNQQIVMTDWEWAGKSRNINLVFIVDVGNGYIRMTPNQNEQRGFLKKILEINPFGNMDTTYRAIRAAMAAGTTFDGHFYIEDESDPKHRNSLEKVKCIIPNTKWLDKKYEKMKET